MDSSRRMSTAAAYGAVISADKINDRLAQPGKARDHALARARRIHPRIASRGYNLPRLEAVAMGREVIGQPDERWDRIARGVAALALDDGFAGDLESDRKLRKREPAPTGHNLAEDEAAIGLIVREHIELRHVGERAITADNDLDGGEGAADRVEDLGSCIGGAITTWRQVARETKGDFRFDDNAGFPPDRDAHRSGVNIGGEDRGCDRRVPRRHADLPSADLDPKPAGDLRLNGPGFDLAPRRAIRGDTIDLVAGEARRDQGFGGLPRPIH